MKKHWKTKRMKELFEILVTLKSEKDVANFLRDLCTLDELEKMSERWEVARLLHEGLSYREVAIKTGASTTTVTRVAHWIKHGEGGYENMLTKRMA